LAALNAEGETWTAELLNAFLTNPAEAVPGNRMPFGGIADETDRANLLAYLATLLAAAEAAPPDVDAAALGAAAGNPDEAAPVAEDTTPPAEAVTPEAVVPAEEAAPAAEVADIAEDALATLVADADRLAGETVAGQCAFCHTFDEGGATSVGPNLFGIVGRDVGAADDYLYSQPLLDLQAGGAVWTLARLDAFIADPAAAVPGNRMPSGGIPDATERANLLAFLANLVPGAAEEIAAELVVEEVALLSAGFTVFQANWGDIQYGLACAACHAVDLVGDVGPALTGDDFRAAWTGRLVADLVIAARDSTGHPGEEVTADDYAAIVAFILRENGVNGGPDALPATEAEQATVTLF
jgi:cytochrome c